MYAYTRETGGEFSGRGVSKRIRAARSLRRLSKRGLQYGCGTLGCKESCHTYVFPANGPKIESRRADSNR
jgi:hypothetical protein